MKQSRTVLRWFGWAIVVAVLASFAAVGLGEVGFLDRADATVNDGWHRLRGTRGPSPGVVLIHVDDETMERVKDPFVFWGPHFAKGIETLRELGASTIGIDFLVKESAEGWFARHDLGHLPQSRSLDASFRGQLYRGDVVLVSSYGVDEAGGVVHQLPTPDYLLVMQDVHATVAVSDIPLDVDSVARTFYPVPLSLQDRPGLSFGLALVIHHLGLDPHAPSWRIAGREVSRASELVGIAFDGPQGTQASVPFWKLLDPGALTERDRSLIQGRIAVVGASFSASPDTLITPYATRTGGQMSGHEVHGNIVSTLLSGRRVHGLGPFGHRLLLFTTGLLLASVSLLTNLRTGTLALVAHTLCLPLVGYAMFLQADLLLPVVSQGVVGILVFGLAYILRYLQEQREREFIGGLFGRYVSEDLLDVILEDPDAVGLGGARREMTILFSDIKGFTTISEQLAPEEVVEMINAWFGRACRPILASGGEVNKFIGDAVMAVWGVPLPVEDHPRRGVEAALAVSQEVEAFRVWMRERFAGRDLPEFDVGVAVHCGPAVAGNIGLEERTEYTVIGDTVNTASRIEGLTRDLDCRVLVSQEVVDALGEDVRTGRSKSVPVKGRKQPVVVFELLGLEKRP